MQKIKKIAVLAFVVIMALSVVSCGKKKATSSEEFSAIYTTEVATLNYLISNKSIDAAATALFVDALVQNDKYGAPVPGIAKSWEPSDDGMVWTVKIRDDVKWVTNKGVEYAKVTANDYVTATKYILDPANASLTADMILEFIAGAEEYYDAMTADMEAKSEDPNNFVPTADFSIVGVKAVDATTIEYTMIQPTPFFFSLLTYSSYLPVNEQFLNEVGADFGVDIDKILYNGEYLFDSWERDKERIYVKNTSYYQADRVHVPVIHYLCVDDGHVALEMFKRGEVSASAIYSDQLEQVLADPDLNNYIFQTKPQAGSYFDAFKYNTPDVNVSTAIKNLNFRKAVFAAENRDVLISTLVPDNVAQYLVNTFVPRTTAVTENGKDYIDFGELPAIEARNPYDLIKAKEYMELAYAELGDTVTWPVVLNYPQGSTEADIQQSQLFKQMMEEAFPGKLAINFKTYGAGEFYNMMDEGDFDFAQSGWGADYADPSNFLHLLLEGEFLDGLYGFSALPEMAEYATMIKAASKLIDLDARYEAYAKAEAYLINNAIINPMFRNGGNYALNCIQNPYDTPQASYGMTPDLFLDRIYGDKPLTKEERNKQRENYNKEVADRASKAK